jgi:hypothetical protein
VAILPENSAVSPARPGVLVTDTIDIGPYTLDPITGLPVGTDEFLLYWYVYEFTTTQDVHSSFGATSGQNDPAIRSLVETDQEPADLQVFISINDGTTFVEVQRLVPISFCNKGRLIRIAFKNNSTSQKFYLASYAILF